MSRIRKQTLSGVKWSALERFSVQGVNFIIGLILARMLSPSDFGIIGMVSIFMSISQSFIDSGFSNALIRKKDCDEVDFSTVFYFNIVVGLLCYALLFFSSGWIALFFKTKLLEDIIKILAVNVFVNSLIVVQVAKFTISINFKIQAKASLIAAIVSGLLGITCAYNGFGVWALVIQQVSSTLIKAILLWFYSKWIPMRIFSWQSFKSLFSFGSKLLISGLIHQVYAQMTTLVIGRFYSVSDLGNYTRGFQFATLPSSNITSVLSRVTLPILAKIQDDDERLILIYRKYIGATSVVIIFSMMLLAALAKPLMLAILTEKWSGAIIYLQIFCFALMFNHVNQINLNLLQVKGRSDLYLRIEIIKKTISIAILLISVPFGVKAICLSTVLYSQIAIMLNTYYTGRFFKLGYFTQLKDFVGYVFFSAIACFPGYLLSYTSFNNWVVLILGTVSSIIIYVMLLMFTKDALFKEYFPILLKRIVSNKRNK